MCKMLQASKALTIEHTNEVFVKMNMLAEHIKEYIQPYPNRYTRGAWEIRVLPHEDLDDEGIEKFWRMFKKFPNDFAAAAVSLLPKDVEFIQYDHLANIIFANKL